MNSYKKYIIHYVGLSVPILALLIYLCLTFDGGTTMHMVMSALTVTFMMLAIAVMLANFAATRTSIGTINIQGDANMLAAVVDVELILQEHRKLVEKTGQVRTYEYASSNALIQKYKRWLTSPVSVAVYPGCVVLCGPQDILQRLKAAAEDL